MNIQDIENKFQILDKRTQRLSEYFNPVVKYRIQHPFITDLQDEYKEDSKIYSLNQYLYSNSSPRAIPKPILNSSSKSNLEKNTETKCINKPVRKKQNLKPRRKVLKIDAMSEFKYKEGYNGAFSFTKLLPERKRKESLETTPQKHIESWADSINGFNNNFSNSASIIRFPIESEYKVNKSYPDDISLEYIKHSYEDVSRISSTNLRYSISPSDVESRMKFKEQDLGNNIILYQLDPNIEIKCDPGIFNVIITDVSNFNAKAFNELSVENKFIQFKTGKKLDLTSEFSEINEKLFKIQVKNSEKAKEFYVYIGKYSVETEKKNLNHIKKYNDLAYIKKDSCVKLPMIIENSNNFSKFATTKKNPLTNALYRFQKINKLFIPELYLAKLSVFENHDYIRKKYSKKLNKYSYDHPLPNK